MKNLRKILCVAVMFAVTTAAVFAWGAKESADVTSAIDLSKDRAGNEITLPAKIEKIISMAPSTTEILIDLGLADKIIAADTNTQKDGLLKQDIPYFNMMTPDTEKLIALNPDVVFTSGMSKAKGKDPFAPVRAAGICVIEIPSSTSIAAIYTDIAFISSVVKAESQGAKIIANMKKEIETIKIPADKKKTVYFEIGAAPHMYSLGSGTFINEMIEIIGAKNILAEQKSWVSVSDETVLSKDPDIILTNVSYLPNPVEEIMGRAGWQTLKAVKEKQVFRIDNNSSSRPNQNIIKALNQMAKAVYPEVFK
ncbi:ABC transporter substrate-binding protein [Treponema pedis]|uniref:ABC transporter substrate-binding protein n=1 Tax=Treponema pedis TaxID=409322 RepID=A0A7S7AX22_9SPIR|nr:ABC transporter substrate-binding protein [Treponema pedis]QOW61161.1 ABC transporter substrate-binding protein [Treponema pedis]